MMYNWILILAAVIPAVFLMIKVYRADRMEKERPRLGLAGGVLFKANCQGGPINLPTT